MSRCLTSDELERLLTQSLDPAELSRAEAHLQDCEVCRAAVEERHKQNRLFDELQNAYVETVSVPDQPPRPEKRPPPERIQGYEILSEIHRGGQGVVYKAVQQATKRTVALKVLLEGPYASAKQRHRFEREIDLIAGLQHPNIVTVYDSGVTSDRRHYFAMEYIHGQPLHGYLLDTRLSIDETLRLFHKICTAVSYAHQRGVIHRDLKPGNIRIDAEGEPHVLDFGLAKTAGSDLRGGAPVTVTGEFVGTLAYASPEQARGDPHLVDIRTDIYSLGVVLYEMLTGKYPYEVVGQMADVLKNIAEAEPKKPSTVRRQINDEVETIILKALAKERNRRYQSAETLARDIEHYLNGEAIDAKRDSTWYILRKTLRIYRTPAVVSLAFFIVVLASSVLAWSLYARATVAEQGAIAERDKALESERIAKSEATKAHRIQQFLQDMLASVDPWSDPEDRRKMTIRALLDQTSSTQLEELKDEPLVRAAIQLTIGLTYRSLAMFSEAEPHLREARSVRQRILGNEHPDSIQAGIEMGRLLERSGSYHESETLYRELLGLTRGVFGKNHALTLRVMADLGVVLWETTKLEEAEHLLRAAVAGLRHLYGAENKIVIGVADDLAKVLNWRGKYRESLEIFQSNLEICRRRLHPKDAVTLVAKTNLGWTHLRMGRPDLAEPLCREAFEGWRRLVGEEHQETMVALQHLGWAVLSATTFCTFVREFSSLSPLIAQYSSSAW